MALNDGGRLFYNRGINYIANYIFTAPNRLAVVINTVPTRSRDNTNPPKTEKEITHKHIVHRVHGNIENLCRVGDIDSLCVNGRGTKQLITIIEPHVNAIERNTVGCGNCAVDLITMNGYRRQDRLNLAARQRDQATHPQDIDPHTITSFHHSYLDNGAAACACSLRIDVCKINSALNLRNIPFDFIIVTANTRTLQFGDQIPGKVKDLNYYVCRLANVITDMCFETMLWPDRVRPVISERGREKFVCLRIGW